MTSLGRASDVREGDMTSLGRASDVRGGPPEPIREISAPSGRDGRRSRGRLHENQTSRARKLKRRGGKVRHRKRNQSIFAPRVTPSHGCSDTAPATASASTTPPPRRIRSDVPNKGPNKGPKSPQNFLPEAPERPTMTSQRTLRGGREGRVGGGGGGGFRGFRVTTSSAVRTGRQASAQNDKLIETSEASWLSQLTPPTLSARAVKS